MYLSQIKFNLQGRFSTGRLGCPFSVSIGLLKGKLTVKKLISDHENHVQDINTFVHYPENLRLNDEEKKMSIPMLKCGASKQKLKYYLSEKRGVPVSLKNIHNLQTAVQYLIAGNQY